MLFKNLEIVELLKYQIFIKKNLDKNSIIQDTLRFFIVFSKRIPLPLGHLWMNFVINY